MKVTKVELVQEITKKSGVARAVVHQVLDAQAEAIKDALKNGDEVSVHGIGKLKTKLRAGRTARNPRTGETVEVLPSIGVSFKASKLVADELN